MKKLILGILFSLFLIVPATMALTLDNVTYSKVVGLDERAIISAVIGEHINVSIDVNDTISTADGSLNTGDATDYSSCSILNITAGIIKCAVNFNTTASNRSLSITINGENVSLGSFTVYSHADDFFRAIDDIDIYVYDNSSRIDITNFDLSGTSFEFKSFNKYNITGGLNISNILNQLNISVTIDAGSNKPTVNSISLGANAQTQLDKILTNVSSDYNASQVDGNATIANLIIDSNLTWHTSQNYSRPRTFVKDGNNWTVTFSDLGATDLNSTNKDDLQTIVNDGTKVLSNVIVAISSLGDLGDDIGTDLNISSNVSLGTTSIATGHSYTFDLNYEDQYGNSGSEPVDVHISAPSFSTVTKYVAPFCGDGTCDADESCSSCSDDCGSCHTSSGGISSSTTTATVTPTISYTLDTIPVGTITFILTDKSVNSTSTDVNSVAASTGDVDTISFTDLTLDTTAEMTDVEMSVEAITPAEFENTLPSEVTSPVSLASDTSKKVKQVYQYVHIKENNVDANAIDKAVIKFKVEKSWIAEQGGKAEDIVLGRYQDDAWVSLDTSLASYDDNYYYFEAESPGLSYFAVFMAEAITTAPATDEANKEVVFSDKVLGNQSSLSQIIKKPGSLAILIIVILAIIVIGMKKTKKKKHKKKK